MANPLTAPIGHPSHFAHQDARAFPGEMSSDRHYGSTVGLPNAGLLMPPGSSLNAHWVHGKTHSDFFDQGAQFANGTATYHLAQNMSNFSPGDTCKGLPTFVERFPLAEAHDMHRKRSYNMWGLSQLNRRLKYNKSDRLKYGSHPRLGIPLFMRDFGYVGVQHLQETDLNRVNQENNFVVDGRARIPNIWLAQSWGQGVSGAVRETNILWLLVRRHRFTDDDVTQPETWNAVVDPYPILSNGVTRASVDRRVPNAVLKARGAVDVSSSSTYWQKPSQAACTELWRGATDLFADAFSPDKTPAIDAVQGGLGLQPDSDKYYISIDPWVSTNREQPPPWTYTGCVSGGDPNNVYHGDFIHIGLVTHVARGPNNRTAHQTALAREALYPEVRNEEYCHALRQLDELEIMVSDGRS
jgi:hypothetical protein